ncbi:hypothetical protein BGZ65_002163 [Modicella reniformis]|uniref:Uncharacterized protein n=1 Tax=Modicella reniformis TaxID=1440133 RepID=A0A9P6IM69_9FUNG|nr:hypothetical protein BGZ65_002163 [Modicella reniformis]
MSITALLADQRVNACIPLESLTKLINETNITPLFANETATTFCDLPRCDTQTVSHAQSKLCQLGGSCPIQLVPFKKGMCRRVRQEGNGTFCVTVLTEAINTYMIKHLDRIGAGGWDSLLSNSTQLRLFIQGMPKGALCNSCTRAMIKPLLNFISERQLTLDASIVAWVRTLQMEMTDSKRCGEGFFDDYSDNCPPQKSNSNHVAKGLSKAMSTIAWICVLFLVLPLIP